MLRHSLTFAALLASGMVVLNAQQSAPTVPSTSATSAPHVSGIGIVAVPGYPFSATVVIETDRPQRDGSVAIRRTVNLIARDALGRTHNEVRRLMPESFHSSPELMEVHLFDPQTMTSTIYYPATHLARQRVLPAPTYAAPKPNPFMTQVDLGTNMLNGLEAKGTRRTTTIPAFTSGSDERVDIVDEFWYSLDMHLNLLVHHSDPRTGDQTAAISGLKREAPPDSMFVLPQGYKLVDEIPPAAATAPSRPLPARDPMGDEVQ
jgi:hypothetical protein